jgi:hypothetical protein
MNTYEKDRNQKIKTTRVYTQLCDKTYQNVTFTLMYIIIL